MRGYISKIRPAGSAIVAVLALNSTYGYAQDAAVSDTAPPLVAPPTVSAPIIAVPVSPPADLSADAATPQPMVQPTAPVAERIAAARAAAEQEAAEQSVKSAPIPQAAPIARSARAEVPTTPPPIERTAEAAPQPEAPVAVMAPAQATAAPEPVVTRTDENAAMNDWVLPTALGGGALLLLGLGAAAVSRRRRGARGETLSDQVVYNDQPVAAPVVPTAAPVPAANLASAGVGGGLAAMVAAPPSAENPFLTPRKRMARARFLLAQQEQAAAGQNAAINDVAPPQTVHAEPQMQTVYRMGADRKRGMTFKPQTR